MGWISWIVLGLIAGFLAKWIMPGRDGNGLIMTILLGIVGSVVGGYVGTILGLGSVNSLNLGSIALAVLGSVLVLFVYRLIKNS